MHFFSAFSLAPCPSHIHFAPMAECSGTADTCPTSTALGGFNQYSLQHKNWILCQCRRLELQSLFDNLNKLHKNEQLWDDLVAEFFTTFPDQVYCTKQSIQNQWDQEQCQFRDWCLSTAIYVQGKASGIGLDDQETILSNKRGPCHELFLEFQ